MDEETRQAIRNLWKSQRPADSVGNVIYAAQQGTLLCSKCNKAATYNEKEQTIDCGCGSKSVDDFGAPC